MSSSPHAREGGAEGFSGEMMLSDQMSIQIRHGFIRKVFFIVTIQLAISTAMAIPAQIYKDEIKSWWADNPSMFWVFLGASFAPLFIVCCCQSALRQFPLNYIVLLIFTLCEGSVIALITIQYSTYSVMVAFGVTAGVTLGLMIFAMQTSIDFTGIGGYLFAALLVLMIFGLVFWLLGSHSDTLQKIYGGCGALIFSLYIVYDVQLIVGGKHKKNQFSVDDYAFAALNLYMDIVNLFLMLLMIFGERD